MNASLYEPLVLAGGAEIPNRIAKAAMEENMAEDGQLPGERLFTLYRTWSNGERASLSPETLWCTPRR